MKKTIYTISFAAIIMAGTIITSCKSSGEKVEKAQENVIEAKKELSQAVKDSIQQFRKESQDKINAQDKSLAEFKARIAKEKKVNRDKYEKNLAELDQKNTDLKKKLADFKEDRIENWESFKKEFTHDMNEFGKSFKDLTIKNTK